MQLVVAVAVVGALLLTLGKGEQQEYVLLGLRNPSSVDDPRLDPADVEASNVMTDAVNNWLWAPSGDPSLVPFGQQQQQQGMFAVQSIPMYFSSKALGDALDRLLARQLKALLAVWRNGTVPVITWNPAVDYNEEPDEFINILLAAGAQYNDYLVDSALFDVYATAFVDRVLVPFLRGANNSSSSEQGPVVMRRVFIDFAPEANTLRFPWGLDFSFNASSSSNNKMLFVQQNASSYRRLWTKMIGRFLYNNSNLIQLAEMIPHAGATAQDKLQLLVQLVWTSSSCRVLPGARSSVSDLLPSWPAGGFTYGPTWFGISTVVIPVRSAGPPAGSFSASSSSSSSAASESSQFPSPSAAFSPVLEQLITLARTANSTLRRISNATASPIPLAVMSLGATALNDAVFPLNTKSQWIANVLDYLVWGSISQEATTVLSSLVHMIIYDNSLYYNGSVSWRHAQRIDNPTRAHLQILSFDDAACCPNDAVFLLPNGTAAANASVCDAVHDKILDLVFGARPVVYLPVSYEGAFRNGIISDASFIGAPVDLPPIPHAGDAASSGENMLENLIHRPLLIASAIVIGVILLGLTTWRIIARHKSIKAARLILQRYSCIRILRRRKGPESSALVEAIDIKQNQKVVVKQFIIVNDYVNALANNEIDKLRAAQGCDHVVQLVQTAFAWKSNRVALTNSTRSPSSNSSRKVFAEADLAEDSSPMLARVQYKQHQQQTHTITGGGNSAKNHLAGTTDALINDGNSFKFPFALIVTKKYSSGDLEQFIRLAKARRSTQASPYTGVPIHDALSIFAQLLRALHYIHFVARAKDPILHRDIKPENILLERRRVRGEKDQWAYLAFLGDFGLAVFRSQLAQHHQQQVAAKSAVAGSPSAAGSGTDSGPKLRASTIRSEHAPSAPPFPDSSFGIESATTYLGSKCIGTRRFMPPEARRGEYCTAGDVFSAGGVLLAMLLADMPDDISIATTDPLVVQKLRADLTREANCPLWLVDLLFGQILLPNPSERPTAIFVLAQLKSKMSKKEQQLAGIVHDPVAVKPSNVPVAADPITVVREEVLDLSSEAVPTAEEVAAEDQHGEPIYERGTGQGDVNTDDDPGLVFETLPEDVEK